MRSLSQALEREIGTGLKHNCEGEVEAIHFENYNFLAVRTDSGVEDILSAAEELKRRTCSKNHSAVEGRIHGWEDTLELFAEVARMSEV